ncbi:MAG: pantetheine-phosphate adenylyltransferase [Deltaproteobacteria bacterium]|nr:MAG: pantetheine-phosphate adenylyltransferase [Deltaproteobacteria bacterium]
MKKKVAIYPGSFDPITNGHIDIIQRGAEIFDELIVAVAYNPQKVSLFSEKERVDIIRQIFKNRKNIKVESFSCLLVDYVARRQAKVVMKGLRFVSDFEYEFQMALTNRRMNNQVETLFMMASEPYSYLSSGLVKEIASLGGSVYGMVPKLVEKRLKEKFRKKSKERK